MNGRRILRALALAVCWLTCALPALAVVVFEKGRPQPTVGYLVRQDEQRIVLRQVLADGSLRTREIFRSEIEDLLIAVSEQRLTELHLDDPGDYRDYAEELAVKRKDPDALLASLRLYLIAAHLDPNRLGRSCLLGMVALARDPQEQRRFRAMAYLLDPNQDRSVLTPTHDPAGNRDQVGRSGMLKAVQAMRRGQRRLALQIAERDPARAEFQRFGDILTLEQFLGIEADIPPETLRKLLMLEWILTREGDEAGTAGRSMPWSQLAGRQQLSSTLPLTLETLTEFDPRECLYRDGRWVRPDPPR